MIERVCDQRQFMKHSLYCIKKTEKRTFHLEVEVGSIAPLYPVNLNLTLLERV